MFDPAITIALSAVVFSIVSLFVNHKFGGKKKVKELQKEINEFQKKFEKATKEKDEKELAKLKVIEPQVMKNMQEMLLLPIKAMVIILPLFFIFIAGVQYLVPVFTIILPFGIHPNELLAFKILEQSAYGSRGFFIVCSIVANLVLEVLYSRVIAPDKPNKKEDKPSPPIIV
ncbi:MAG: EMC3/TMCO1 family protein [Candidatus Micrarchaeota archaeon]|nr:EMC3/TMCO1 family protein [Candidatus Micrarchaeota archaeon]